MSIITKAPIPSALIRDPVMALQEMRRLIAAFEARYAPPPPAMLRPLWNIDPMISNSQVMPAATPAWRGLRMSIPDRDFTVNSYVLQFSQPSGLGSGVTCGVCVYSLVLDTSRTVPTYRATLVPGSLGIGTYGVLLTTFTEVIIEEGSGLATTVKGPTPFTLQRGRSYLVMVATDVGAAAGVDSIYTKGGAGAGLYYDTDGSTTQYRTPPAPFSFGAENATLAPVAGAPQLLPAYLGETYPVPGVVLHGPSAPRAAALY